MILTHEPVLLSAFDPKQTLITSKGLQGQKFEEHCTQVPSAS